MKPVLGLLLLTLAGGCVAVRPEAVPEPQPSQGSGYATVERRDFTHALRIHGTVESIQSYTFTAPRMAGPGPNALIITRLAPNGASVKRGDLLVEFDRQNQQKTVLDKQAEYRDLVEQIKKKQAEHAAARARDETELKQAENDVLTAKLEMRKNEILSRIDVEKNQLNLEEAEARLKQLRETMNLRREVARAELRILEIQRDRAHSAMLHARNNVEKMAIYSPLDGLVVLNSYWKGGRMAEAQEGDEIHPGVPFLQVVNPTAMQVRARVNQADVPYLRVGQRIQVSLDAYPGLSFPGEVRQIAAIGITSQLSRKVRTFTAVFSIEGSDARLLPDLSAAVDVELEGRDQVLVLPRDTVVKENEKAYVFAKQGAAFEKQEVKLGPTSDCEAVVESGVSAGTIVLRHSGAGT